MGNRQAWVILSKNKASIFQGWLYLLTKAILEKLQTAFSLSFARVHDNFVARLSAAQGQQAIPLSYLPEMAYFLAA
jgi:hypothetical protein